VIVRSEGAGYTVSIGAVVAREPLRSRNLLFGVVRRSGLRDRKRWGARLGG
jgi:hypothetical protein